MPKARALADLVLPLSALLLMLSGCGSSGGSSYSGTGGSSSASGGSATSGGTGGASSSGGSGGSTGSGAATGGSGGSNVCPVGTDGCPCSSTSACSPGLTCIGVTCYPDACPAPTCGGNPQGRWKVTTGCTEGSLTSCDVENTDVALNGVLDLREDGTATTGFGMTTTCQACNCDSYAANETPSEATYTVSDNTLTISTANGPVGFTFCAHDDQLDFYQVNAGVQFLFTAVRDEGMGGVPNAPE